ncbi:MAG: hypothetical protein JSV03_15690 [Planctomycetota bacterium]|nr:MAG: hypothetical protein JSV03_15690 [Planctomycetota bacterium]
MKTAFVVLKVFFLACLCLALSVSASESQWAPDWPKDWLAAWNDPPPELRPLQIVHGLTENQAGVEYISAIKEVGLGGIVCNVNFHDYLRSEANWATLIKAVDACREVGLIVWIYDEQGYPSGAAGGLVLQTNPQFEALALTYNPQLSDPFKLRPSYEHTHASNNVYAARRYPNIIDETAVDCFIGKTHEAYRRRLGPHLGTTVKAFFTDEPSLMVVNIGRLPQHISAKVKVIDPIDVSIQPLPSVPWVKEMPVKYKQRYGQDLMAVRRSLFTGDSADDRLIRRRFWALISDLMAERYFGKIQNWCRNNNIASSGHILCEESVIRHVPLEGNALKVLGRMDIPGLDMLSSDPATVFHQGWLTATLPASAAILNGRRQVMTEVSDYAQRAFNKPPATLPQMQATAAWQAALGVTEFTLYYGSIHRILADTQPDKSQRSREDYQSYYDYVGRLNALLRNARLTPRVLLYYPIYDLWSEFLPVAENLTLQTQSTRTQQLVQSFINLGKKLLTSQIPFVLVDHELLGSAKIRDKKVCIADRRFDALILPAGVQLPESVARNVDKFAAAEGCIQRHESSNADIDIDKLQQLTGSCRLQPAGDNVIMGYFVRDGRSILLLVNVGKQPYVGKIPVVNPEAWSVADPATGRIKKADVDELSSIRVNLPTYSTVLLIGP